MSKDFYLKSLKRQMSALQAARANTLAELEQHRQNNDPDSGGQAEQVLADLAAGEENLRRLADNYVRSQQPAPPISEEERMAKPWDRMTPDDGLEIAKKSRYARDLNWNDPNVRAGYAAVLRSRGKG